MCNVNVMSVCWTLLIARVFIIYSCATSWNMKRRTAAVYSYVRRSKTSSPLTEVCQCEKHGAEVRRVRVQPRKQDFVLFCNFRACHDSYPRLNIRIREGVNPLLSQNKMKKNVIYFGPHTQGHLLGGKSDFLKTPTTRFFKFLYLSRTPKLTFHTFWNFFQNIFKKRFKSSDTPWLFDLEYMYCILTHRLIFAVICGNLQML